MEVGDRVEHTDWYWYGKGQIVTVNVNDFGTLDYQVRWDDPGLDDDTYLEEELRKHG